jgi:outer membrane protein
MSGRFMHAAVALFVAGSLIVSPLYAQDQQSPAPTETPAQPQTPKTPVYQPPQPTAGPPSSPARGLKLGPDYSKGQSWFPNIFAPYIEAHIPEPELTNTPRINQLVQDGKLMLSLEDAISLGLENNLALAVERYVPWLDEAQLLYAKSGANAPVRFDPSLTSTLSLQQSTSPINNFFFAGVAPTSGSGTPTATIPLGVINHTATANFQYTQGFAPGTQVQLTFDNTRGSTNLASDLFNPYNQSTLTFEVTQPLLSGFGKTVNTRYIIEAKNTVKVGESQFKQQVMTTITQVAQDYWELVYAREAVKVEQVAVAADQQLYENNKKQLEIGTMAPLDVITAQSQLATDQQALVQAQTNQLLDETTLLVAITKDALAPQLKGIEIVPTTPIFTPTPESISLEDAVHEAWQKRPELQQDELNLKNAGIEVKATQNLMRPQVNLFAQYSAVGLAGKQTSVTETPTAFAANLNSPVVDAAGVQSGLFASEIAAATTNIQIFQSGLGEDWRRMIDGTYPSFEGGVNITLPIRNRAAEANNATAQLTQREQEVEYRQEQSTILLNVRQALITLEQDRAAIAAAQEARIYAQQSYDDSVKQLQLGSTNAFTVVQKEQLLTAAEGVELRDRVNLIEAELTFNQAMGRTLEVHNITLADAQSGHMQKAPNIPGRPEPNSGVSGYR